jgi:hypothetical protein
MSYLTVFISLLVGDLDLEKEVLLPMVGEERREQGGGRGRRNMVQLLTVNT